MDFFSAETDNQYLLHIIGPIYLKPFHHQAIADYIHFPLWITIFTFFKNVSVILSDTVYHA